MKASRFAASSTTDPSASPNYPIPTLNPTQRSFLMADPVISGNSVFSHVFIGASDVQKSAAFYDAALGALGVKNLGPFANGWILYGRDKPAFIIARPGNGEPPSSNGGTVGFAAASTAEVAAFQRARPAH